MEQVVLGELLCKARGIDPPRGHEKGTCTMCGSSGDDLLPLGLRKTFTGAEFIGSGTIACPWCNYLYEDQRYRYHDWIVTAKRFVELKPGEVLPALFSLDPAELPFALYTTETYQKQGYLRLARRGVNCSLETFATAIDTVLLFISRAALVKDLRFIEWCMREGIYRSDLLAGSPRVKILREIEAKYGNAKQVLERVRTSWKGLNFRWAVLFALQDAETIQIGDIDDW